MFFVYRYGPPTGRPETPPQLSVCYRSLRLTWAIERAAWQRRHDGALYWIARANEPAHRSEVAA